jgi:hypothetical protein
MSVVVASDLRSSFGPVRHQRARPTCLAFAASDTHAMLRTAWSELSCEYLFFMAQQRAGRPPTVGALLPKVLESLEHDGQPHESGWPYIASLPTDLTRWRPPGAVGTLFTRAGATSSPTISEVILALNAGRPSIVLLMLSKSFFHATASGIIDAGSEEAPDPARRHAVIAVGHGQIGPHIAILVRNSWGAKWADSGYAWLTERYLAPRIFNMALLT